MPWLLKCLYTRRMYSTATEINTKIQIHTIIVISAIYIYYVKRVMLKRSYHRVLLINVVCRLFVIVLRIPKTIGKIDNFFYKTEIYILKNENRIRRYVDLLGERERK